MFLADAIENATNIVALISSIVGLAVVAAPSLVSAIIFIVKAIKNKNWKTIMSVADAAMKTVEEYSKAHSTMTSEEKLDMALETIQESLAAMNITWTDADKEQAKAYINQSISWANSLK